MDSLDRKRISDIFWKLSSAIERLAENQGIILPELTKGAKLELYDFINDFELKRLPDDNDGNEP